MQSIAEHASTIGSDEQPFDELKRHILKSFQPSPDEVISDIKIIHPDITKGSHNEMLKRFFLRALPPLVQAVLAGTAITDLHEAAKIADNVMATQNSISPTCFTVTSPTIQTPVVPNPSESIDPIAALQVQIREINTQLAALYHGRHKDNQH